MITGMKYMINLLRGCLSYHCMGQCQQVRACKITWNLILVIVICRSYYKQHPTQIFSSCLGELAFINPFVLALFYFVCCACFCHVPKLNKLELSLNWHRRLQPKFLSSGSGGNGRNGFMQYQGFQLRTKCCNSGRSGVLFRPSHFTLYGKDTTSILSKTKFDL